MTKTAIHKAIQSVSIQGGFGSFHQIAANNYFAIEETEIEILPKNTFQHLVSAVADKSSDFGIIAIENSLVGSILPNYTLLKNADVKIIGETSLQIEQNLVGFKGQKMEEIKEVFSHPMALLQCEDFFIQFPNINLTEAEDTALSAKNIRENNLQNVGAICSSAAAEKYDLEILAPSIQTFKQNFTRFLVITHSDTVIANNIKLNKISLYFSALHEVGSLSKVLQLFEKYNINLTKIQSLPIPEHNWKYFFYVDLLIDDYSDYQNALEELKLITDKLKILGEYPCS